MNYISTTGNVLKLSCKVDIWAYGIVVCKVFTGFDLFPKATARKGQHRFVWRETRIELAIKNCCDKIRIHTSDRENHATIFDIIDGAVTTNPNHRYDIDEIYSLLNDQCFQLLQRTTSI